MKFTLTYDGSLPSAANETRVPEKMKLRRVFHPQIRELIAIHPYLAGEFEKDLKLRVGAFSGQRLLPPHTCRNLEFIPLVNDHLHLVCELDILFLRRQSPGSLFEKRGDLDNRILTLFDGLRIPKTDAEIPATFQPTEKETPMLCLLEDDSLITAFNIRSERLLASPSSNDSDVRLIIGVTVKATMMVMGTMGWVFD